MNALISLFPSAANLLKVVFTCVACFLNGKEVEIDVIELKNGHNFAKGCRWAVTVDGCFTLNQLKIAEYEGFSSPFGMSKKQAIAKARELMELAEDYNRLTCEVFSNSRVVKGKEIAHNTESIKKVRSTLDFIEGKFAKYNVVL